jgi:S1-C subfamily serine protease
MTDSSWENAPRQDRVAFDLNHVLSSIVSIKSHIPEDAFTATVLGTERVGSGVVIREDGVILTVGYLVTEAETIWITDNKGRAISGTVLGYDQESGLGLIQALGKLDLPAIDIGSSAAIEEGDKVILAGHGGRRGAVSANVIGLREFAGYWEYLLDRAIFTAPAHPNWGGTGLISADGKLLGIGSLFIQQSQEGQQPVDGNMVVPIDLLAPIYDDMLTYGFPNKPQRPWLGVFCTEAEDRLVVAGVSEGGPADLADLQSGDLIQKIDGRPVSTLADFFRQIWSLGPAGVEVPITVHRDGERLDLSVPSIARRDLLKGPQLH